MSKERKTLKILSLVMWLLSLIVLIGGIHGAVASPEPLLIAYSLVLSVFCFYTGWLGIKGANTPSAVGAYPKCCIVIAIVCILWFIAVAMGWIESDSHGPMMLKYLSLAMFVDAALGCSYGKKVSEQVSL